MKSSLLTLYRSTVYLGLFVVLIHAGCSEPKSETSSATEPASEKAAPANETPKDQAAEAAPAANPAPAAAKTAAAKTAAANPVAPAAALKPAEPAVAPAGQPTPAVAPANVKLGADGKPIVKVKTLPEAKLKIDEMAQEMTKLITALRVAGKDKAKVEKLNADFESKNKRLTREIEGIQSALSPEDLAEFEGYAKQKIAPLAQLLIQAYFQASGMNARFDGQ